MEENVTLSGNVTWTNLGLWPWTGALEGSGPGEYSSREFLGAQLRELRLKVRDPGAQVSEGGPTGLTGPNEGPNFEPF